MCIDLWLQTVEIYINMYKDRRYMYDKFQTTLSLLVYVLLLIIIFVISSIYLVFFAQGLTIPHMYTKVANVLLYSSTKLIIITRQKDKKNK